MVTVKMRTVIPIEGQFVCTETSLQFKILQQEEFKFNIDRNQYNFYNQSISYYQVEITERITECYNVLKFHL